MITRQQIVSLATQVFTTGNIPSELRKIVKEFVEESGGNFETFKANRQKKLERNGGFEKGYVQREKVLPIGNNALSTKLRRDSKRDVQTGAERTIGEINALGIWPMEEKLVRDNIPAITENQARLNNIPNYQAKVRIADKTELKDLLHKKFLEESIEFLTAGEKDDVLEDLADLLDIIDAYQQL